MTGTSCIFSRLDSDIINSHILPRLNDGKDLTAFSSVSSYLRHLICNNNNQDLWRNICTSKWPSLMDPIVNDVISTFPGGYRSFFSDAFPSLHHHTNSHCSYPHPPDLIHAIDMYIDGEPLFSRIRVESFNRENWPPYYLSDTFDVTFYEYWKVKPLGHIHIPVNASWSEYLKENLKLSWIVIDPTQKRAANLFRYTCKPLSAALRQVYNVYHEVVYGTVMAGESQVRSEMVNCLVKVMCFSNDGDGLDVMRVMVEMEDMTRNRDLCYSEARKKFDLPKQEFDKFQISKLQRKKNRKRK